MVRKWWSLVVFVTSTAALALAVYTLITSRTAHASADRVAAQAVEIPQPSGWVAFSADVVITHADGGQTAYGRYYRDSHGCTRLETGPEGETFVISIMNIPDVAYYRWNKNRGVDWISGPMSLPRDKWEPIRRRENIVGLVKHPTLVEIRPGRKYNLRASTGLTAYRYVNLGGTVSLQVPDLNFFDVLKQTLEGRREAYSNIEILPQPEELFRPPAGANVVTTTKVGGIVTQPVEKSAEHAEHMMRGQTQ